MDKEATRKGFGKALVELGELNDKVVALSADLTESTSCKEFKEKYPDRYMEMGVAEQNSIGVAAGLSFTGYIPFVTSFAVFMPNRCLDQIRVSVAYNNANVKIVASHAGLVTGHDGATHQALEDISIMRSIPNMTVVVPCDFTEAVKATKTIAYREGPCYLRLMREKTPKITDENTRFDVGVANVMRDGEDITIIACGEMVSAALEAAERLQEENISVAVVNMHTIKPIDKECILGYAEKTKAIVTAEDHQVNGGLGSAVSEVVSSENPIVVKRVGVQDRFGQSGTAEELMKEYNITVEDIINEVRNAISAAKK